MTYTEMWMRLVPRYGEAEAKAVARMVLDIGFGLSMADVLCGRDEQLSADRQQELERMTVRLERGEPVQYVLGWAEFGHLMLHVEPGVLIPRPETLEMCRLIVSREQSVRQTAALRILDIGTGSGCIALTLADALPQASVTAWDIDDTALSVAKGNAERLGISVRVEKADALNPPDGHECWDIIVSNPPYVMESERNTMEQHVVDHEPAKALFVPDEQPLLFYESIGRYAMRSLCSDGYLVAEINARLGQPTQRLFRQLGFDNCRIVADGYGRDRFVVASKSEQTLDNLVNTLTE